MLGYEWANTFIISSPHPVEEPIPPEQAPLPCHQTFPMYDRGGFEVPGTLFSITPPPPPAVEEDYPLVRLYGLSQQMPPAALAEPEPPSGSTMRIGLNLGGRTYFASSPDGELMRLGPNVYRRSGGSAWAGAGGGVSASMVVAPACKARCQAEGCGADLTRAKHYHRRHKVCEFHSKAAAVVTHGLTQRFCQQCSRFHILSEFDQGKRSCRKRLADHNRRRRKTHPPPAIPAMSPPHQQDGCSATGAAVTSPPNVTAAKPSVEGTSPGGGIPPAAAAALVLPPASPTRMALGRCFHPTEGFLGANNSSPSSSSPSPCSSSRSSSSSVLTHVANFGSHNRRIGMSIWEANVDN